MHLSFSIPFSLIAMVAASPLSERATKPATFFLAGDSTTASLSGSGGGWGDGFLGTLANKAIGTNFGHNGATTVSFVSDGDWANVLAAVKKNKAAYTPYVTIQFGHNDQKVTANISIDEYSANLKAMAKAVTAAGGTPIIVTSLSRRKYSTSTGLIKPDLVEVVAAALSVASELGAAYIDLNKASMAYLDAIGAVDGVKYNRISTDYTHLNAAGGVVFGNMVAELILKSAVGNAVTGFITPNATIVKDIASGTFVL